MNNLLKEKISQNIISVIGDELDRLTKITNDELMEKHRIENEKYLAEENRKIQEIKSDYDQKLEVLAKKEEVLEKQLKDTREHMDAKEKVSIYQRYENTIQTKNDEIKILQFKIKGLEEQLRKFKLKESENNEEKVNSDGVINDHVIVNQEIVEELENDYDNVDQEEEAQEEEVEEEVEEEEEELEMEWVTHKKVNYLSDGDYLYNEDNLEKAVGYKTKKGNWKLYKV